MINPSDFQRIFKTQHEVVLAQTQGLTMEDMLLQPPNGGNCMAWVLGHLNDNLINLIGLVGGEVPEDLSVYHRFGYGSDPVNGPELLLTNPDKLLKDYGALNQIFSERLGDPAALELLAREPGAEKDPAWQLFFLNFHHTYHVGQLELLRNLAGHTEKLI